MFEVVDSSVTSGGVVSIGVKASALGAGSSSTGVAAFTFAFSAGREAMVAILAGSAIFLFGMRNQPCGWRDTLPSNSFRRINSASSTPSLAAMFGRESPDFTS